MRASAILPSLNAGKLSPLMEGRVDFNKYPKGLKVCRNFVPLVQGPVTKRPGTKFVASSKDSTKKSRLLRFEFSTEQAFAIELSDLRARFYKNHQLITQVAQNITGITKANPAVVTYSGSDTYANGDKVLITGVVGMTQVNNREFTVANVNTGANTFELSGVDSSAYGTYSSGGTVAEIYEIATPYLEADLFEITYTQSLDVMYLAHNDYAPRKLSRASDTNWTLAAIEFKDGPYQASNVASYKTLTPSAGGLGATITMTAGTAETISGAANNGAGLVRITSTTHDFQTGDRIYITGVTGTTEANGTWTVTRISTTTFDLQGSAFANAYVGGGTATPAIFETAVVGQFVTHTFNNQRGFGVITTVTSPVLVSLEVKAVFNGTNTSDNWALGAWTSTLGYPAAVAFFGDRLYWGGGGPTKQRIDGSVVGDYENMSPRTAANLVVDDGAVSFSLSSNTAQSVRWMMDDEKGLLIGTQGGEWILRATVNGEAITPDNVKADQSTSFGSSTANPLRTGKAVLFVQRAGRKIRELAYVFQNDGFEAPDLTVLSEDISLSGVVQMAFQAQPHPVVWACRTDGVLIGLSYDRGQDMVAWHDHVLGGTGTVVESVACIPNPDNDGDELWMVVKRTINSATVRTIEYMDKFRESDDAKEDAFFVDCGSTYDSSATTTISGLNWLEGQVVTVLADGAAHATKTVSGGSITLDVSASVVQVGLGYTADIQTERLEAGAADGTSQGKNKRIHRVIMRLHETLGLKFGKDADNLEILPFRSTSDVYGDSPDLFTGDKEVLWPHGTDNLARIYVQSYQPFPATIVALMPTVTTQDRG